MKQRIGALVRSARLKAGLTQEELADRVGLTVQALSNVERSQTEPKLSTFVALAGTLQLPMEALLKSIALEPESPARMERLGKLEAILFGLDDKGLDIALGQLEVLTDYHKR